jgi:hypothetical protein
MGRNWFTYRAGTLLSVMAVAGGSVGTITARGGIPQTLVGTWGKTIPEAAFTRDHVAGEPPGYYAINIAASGHTDMYHASDSSMVSASIPFTHMQAVVSGHTVTFGRTADGRCPGKGVYHWVSSGSTLAFTVMKEGCGPRKVLMTAGTFAFKH